MTFNIQCGNIFSATRTMKRRGGMLLLIIVMVLTYWGCGSSNDSETSRITEGNESGFRMAIQMPAGSDPSDIERFEISVTGPGISLYPRVNSVGSIPQSVALGDVNGDKVLDVVTANTNSDDVSILLGIGDGSFLAAETVRVGDSPGSVALGDVSGDQVLDVVTANQDSNDVSILLGNGGGNFIAADPPVVSVGNGPSSVALGDVNDDKMLDVVTANTNSDDVSILLGNGDGSFMPADPPVVPVGVTPVAVALGDVDGKDGLDIVTANSGLDTVSILLGNGDGSFMPADPPVVRVGNSPVAVALGDVDGKDGLDVVTANSGSGRDSVSILLGIGDGSFLAAKTFPVGDSPGSVALGDVSGDQVLDVVTANQDSNDVSILLGNGGGVSFSEQRFLVGQRPTSVALVAVQDVPFDVNGDRFLDIITTNSVADSVSILRSDAFLKNIELTPRYERVTINGQDELVFYLTLPDEVEVPLGPNRTFTVQAFLPNDPEPVLIGSKTQMISITTTSIVIELEPTSSSQ